MISAQKPAPNVPEWPSYGNFFKVTQNPHFLKKCKGESKGNFSSYGIFRKVTQNPHFLKKCKGRTKGNVSKIVQKVALV